ncbi:phage minor head protein [Rodentibacter caecimuris]|uniref:phage head morphogenesis protein n=1 Tax=Rodentibacter caecimuris TaxID=1796644 RepID=UPI00211A7999
MWLFPNAIEREYVNYLRGIVENISKTVDEKLLEIQPHFKENVRQDSFSDTLERWLVELLQAVLFFVDEKEIALFVQNYIRQTANFNSKQFHKVAKSVYGVNIFTTEPWLEEALRLAEWENIRLIKSISTQTLEKLRTRFVQAVRSGERWENVVDDVKNILNVTDKRATLIARDQVGKLNAHLTKLRQQNVGVKSYIWRGMLDERERAHHVEREGRQFDWDDPPDDGHPGQPILCRCYAEAVFPEFKDLNGVIYAE